MSATMAAARSCDGAEHVAWGTGVAGGLTSVGTARRPHEAPHARGGTPVARTKRRTPAVVMQREGGTPVARAKRRTPVVVGVAG
jgi:hypothetical protein